jgi:hypothetical protein
MILNFVTKHKVELVGTGVGMLLGFLYYFFIGCSNGSCIISSNPFITTSYGGLMGYFISGLFKKQ